MNAPIGQQSRLLPAQICNMDALAGGEAGFGDPAPRGAGVVADVVGQDHPPPVPKSPGDLWLLAYQSKLPPLLRAVKFDGDGRIKELDFYNKSEDRKSVV